jgi:putative ABC transport system permease protein
VIFGEAEPLGQRIQRPNDSDQESDFVITGIIKDLPENSHFHANFITPLVYTWGNQDEWKQDFLLTYISLQKGVDPLKVSERVNLMCQKLSEKFPEIRGTQSFLQPITSIHLSSNLKDELEANGSRLQVYVAGFIGLIILVIAWINYINLETARFVTRAREVGVRRIIGSSKTDLAFQFLVEYFCVLLLSFVLAILFVTLILPRFSYLTGIPITTIQWPQPTIWIISLAVLTAGSFLVGIYPAVFLMRLNPAASLKGNFGSYNRGGMIRRSLIIVQFCSSLILIGFVLVIHNQLDFMRFANKKFDVENVIAIRNPTAYSNEEVIEKHNAYKSLENKLRGNASVKMVTSSSAIPGTEIGFTYINLLKRNVSDPFDPTHFKTVFIDYNYIPFYGLKLLAGRNFDPPRPAKEWINPWEDEHWLTLILNESAIKALGFNSPEEAVDQIVEFENFENHFQKHKIIGVVADYHHEAIKKEVFPMILSPNYGGFQQVYYSIRLQEGTTPQNAIASVEKNWKETFPEKPFEFFFLDDYYDRQFKSELHFGRIFMVFAGIAIFIACLGILGMTLFEANARLKEISIRKVLGASGASLVALLSRDNLRLVILSSVVAMPLIYFSASEWLSRYPVKIEISGLFFLIPMGALLLMVMLTSSFQTIKAANTNPVDHLKNE